MVNELAGQPFEGIATVAKPETWRAFHDFVLLDPADKGPPPGTTLAAVEMRLAFLLGELLEAVKVLAATLPAIQRQAGAAGLGVDTTALARLDLHLPVFPYWPRSPDQMSEADFDQVLADERPLLDDALLVLRRLRVAQPLARAIASAADDLYRKAAAGSYLRDRLRNGATPEHVREQGRGGPAGPPVDDVVVTLPERDGGDIDNKRGKTDILFATGTNHVLVAECKVWDGPKSLVGAVDQVLGYLTWRDTRAAVIMFVPNKDPMPVLDQVSKQLNAHPRCW